MDGVQSGMARSSAAPPDGGTHYRAFISYSHRDEETARKLHRWLETYRIPKRLIGRESPFGPVPRRLVPIFRDRLELSAASDLNATVRAALGASEALLVLCSPAARSSQWVNAEIRLFRALHPGRPVIAALLDGEPEESFPPALLEPDSNGVTKEPVAADFRRTHDGLRLGRLKIVAGLAGLALDQLIQREAQRQMHRVIAVTLLSLFVALIMALMLTYVVHARQEAEHERHQAEGLIEFMLTDLRDRLKGVGRLDILRSVNERALDYYGGQDLSAFPVESLERRARILHAMGEDDQRRGESDAALAKFREAHRVTGELLKSAPDDPQRIYAHAQSEFWIAYVDFRGQRHEEARKGFLAYRALAQRLTQIEPGNLSYLRELAYAEGNLCSIAIALKEGRAEDLKSCRTSLETMERIAAAEPDDLDIRGDVANRHGWMADAERLLGRNEQALAHRTHQLAIIETLLKRDPRNATYLEDWMLTRYTTADLLEALGRRDEALELRSESRRTIDSLIASDPENNDWRLWRKKFEVSPTID